MRQLPPTSELHRGVVGTRFFSVFVVQALDLDEDRGDVIVPAPLIRYIYEFADCGFQLVGDDDIPELVVFQHVRQAVVVWRERSQVQWELNLDALKE